MKWLSKQLYIMSDYSQNEVNSWSGWSGLQWVLDAPSFEFLTKNPIENPSSVDSKPSDLEEVVFFAMKLIGEFILNQVNALISGKFDHDSFWKSFDNAFKYAYASLATHIAITMHNERITFHKFFTGI